MGGITLLADAITTGTPRYGLFLRVFLCGPYSLVVTFFVMGGMGFWWPQGAAGIDHVAMPIVLFPLIWVGVLLYAVLVDHLLRAALVMSALILGNGILIALG